MKKIRFQWLVRLAVAGVVGLVVGATVSRFLPSKGGSLEQVGGSVRPSMQSLQEKESLTHRVSHVIRQGAGAADLSRLAETIQQAMPSELGGVLDQLKMPNDPLEATLVAIALKRWFERDASGAIDYVNARQDLWYAAILQWAEVDAKAAAEAIADGRVQAENEQEVLAVLVARLAESDPSLAMSVALGMPLRGYAAQNAYRQVIRGLCQEDPNVAVEMLERVPAAVKDSATSVVAWEWGARDGASALSWIKDQPHSSRSRYLLGIGWAKQDPQAVLDHLDELAKYPDSRPALMASALANWWKRDADEAQRWLENASLTDKETEFVQRSLVLELAKTDPEAAIRLNAEAISQGHQSQGQYVYGAWAARDPEAVLSWAQSLPLGAERDDGLLAAIQELSQQDPVAMLEHLPKLAQSMTKGSGWHETASTLIPVLAARGREASERWIHSLPASIRTEFLGKYSNHWQARAPEEAVDFLLEQPIDRGLIDITQNVVGKQLARRDPAAASKLVSGFQDLQMREVGTRNVLSNWLATEPQAAEAWVDTLTDPSMRDKAFQFLAEHYQLKDPDVAFGHANRVEDPYQRYESVRDAIRMVDDVSLARAYLEQVDLLEADREALVRKLDRR